MPFLKSDLGSEHQKRSGDAPCPVTRGGEVEAITNNPCKPHQLLKLKDRYRRPKAREQIGEGIVKLAVNKELKRRASRDEERNMQAMSN